MNRSDKQLHRDAVILAGIKKQPIGKGIRAKCFECTGGSYKGIRYCMEKKCPLWPFRFGFNPFSTRGGAKESADAGRRNAANRMAEIEKGHRIIPLPFEKETSNAGKYGNMSQGEQGRLKEKRPKVHVAAVQYAIIQFLTARVKSSRHFTGMDIERLLIVGKVHLGSYKMRELRKLNAVYDLFDLVSKRESKYFIKKDYPALVELLGGLTIY